MFQRLISNYLVYIILFLQQILKYFLIRQMLKLYRELERKPPAVLLLAQHVLDVELGEDAVVKELLDLPWFSQQLHLLEFHDLYVLV